MKSFWRASILSDKAFGSEGLGIRPFKKGDEDLFKNSKKREREKCSTRRKEAEAKRKRLYTLLLVVSVLAGSSLGATALNTEKIVRAEAVPDTANKEETASEAVLVTESAADTGTTLEPDDASGFEVVTDTSAAGKTSEAEASETFPETSAKVVPVRLSAEDLPGEDEIVQSTVCELDVEPSANPEEGREKNSDGNLDSDSGGGRETDTDESLNLNPGKNRQTDSTENLQTGFVEELNANEGVQADSREGWTMDAEKDVDPEASDPEASEKSIRFYPNGMDFDEAETEFAESEEDSTASEAAESEEDLASSESVGSGEDAATVKSAESEEDAVASRSEETSSDVGTNSGIQEDVQYLYAPATVRLFQKEIIPKPEEICLTEKSPRVLNRHSVYITHNRTCRLLKEGQDYEIVRENSGGGYAYSYRIFASNFAREGSYAVTVCSRDRKGQITTNAISRNDTGADSVETGNNAAQNGTDVNALDIETSGRSDGEVQNGEASGQSAAESLAVDTSARFPTDASDDGIPQDSYSPGFIVDGTAPTCTIAGLRSKNTKISGEKMNVTILPRDNVSLEEVCIWVNDDEEQRYSGEELETALAEGNGGIRVPIRTAMAAQTIVVRVTDSAGNESGECRWKFTLSRRDSAGLRNAAAASVSMAAVSAVILIMVVYRKKKMGIAKPEQM